LLLPDLTFHYRERRAQTARCPETLDGPVGHVFHRWGKQRQGR